MGTPLRVLVIEDSEDDAALVVRELRRGGYEPVVRRVDTAAAMRAGIEEDPWDIIISDYAMPHFSAPAALTLYQERGLDVPFIIVSGTIGEETAVAAMKAGAHDYLMKGKLARLVPAIQRELRETEGRRARRRAEEALRQGEARRGAILEAALDCIITIDHEGRILEFNAAAEKTFGYSRAKVLGREMAELIIPPGLRERHRQGLAHYLATGEGPVLDKRLEMTAMRADGTEFPIELAVTRIVLDGPPMFTAYVRDITERKQAGEEADRQEREVETFAGLVTSLARSLELDAILERVVGEAKALGQADFAYLVLEDGREQMAVVRAQTGVSVSTLPGLTVEKGKGMAGQALGFGELLVTDDYLQDSRFTHTEEMDAVARAERTVAQAAVPIVHEGTALGVLVVARRTRRPFSLANLQVLVRLADAASLAFHHALLYEQATKRAAALEHLWRAGQALSRPLALRETLDRIVQTARDLLRADYALLTLWEAACEHLALAAQVGTQSLAPNRVFRLGEGGIGAVAATRQTLVVNDYRGFPARLPELAALTGCIVVPLLVEERLIGTLSIGVTESGRTFTAEDRQFLELLAHPAAIALENARLYEALKQEAALLEARVEDRTQKLQEARQRADEASRSKSEFLANMSHELRTPLNSILGFSELLQIQTFGPLNEKQLRYVRNVLVSGRHLLTLISEILDLSKVEAGRLELHPESFVLPKALKTFLDDIRPQAEAKEVQLVLQVDQTLELLTADPVRFKQILYNLLSNAVKFTPAGGHVTLAARPVENGCVEIAVTDTGIGIKAEDLPRLFQPFTQLESALSKHYQGTGLGLALTRRLVELHGGQIRAESEGEGKGTTFTVRLPLGAPDHPRD